MHRWALERTGPDPLTSWAPDTLSCHVLLALDELVAALKCQSLRCYFHPRCNVMLQCARGNSVWAKKKKCVRRMERVLFSSSSLYPISDFFSLLFFIQQSISRRHARLVWFPWKFLISDDNNVYHYWECWMYRQFVCIHKLFDDTLRSNRRFSSRFTHRLPVYSRHACYVQRCVSFNRSVI